MNFFFAKKNFGLKVDTLLKRKMKSLKLSICIEHFFFTSSCTNGNFAKFESPGAMFTTLFLRN
jgi:hypothetical protein